MTSFKNVLADNIKRNYQTKTRESYETLIAKWSLNNWLTDEEVTELLALLDTYYPETTTQPTV